MNIVLYEPEIPQNTGNIGRTCVATGTKLHMIRPFGFEINDKQLKRAGMDYWKDLDVSYYDSYSDFLEFYNKEKERTGARLFMATTKALNNYCEVSYAPDDFIMFGSEGAGIDEEILVKNKEGCIRIPMRQQYRSLNLSNSVAIVLYEALRQNNFEGALVEGSLHRLSWED